MTIDPVGLEAGLSAIAGLGQYRQRRVAESPQHILLKVEGRELLNFNSNNYLGLASHPAVIAAFKKGADEYGVGSGSAHLMSGHNRLHHVLEEELADFTGRERVLLFSTGYMANLGVIATLARGGTVYHDRLNHASLLDGGLLSGARFKRYRHLDMQHLKQLLNASSTAKNLIVTDGVFSMDGDLAPLIEMSELARQTNAGLLVDDAHGLTVLGRQGGGIVEHYQLDQSQVPVLVGTLSKGFGTFGAFVGGSKQLIETLIQQARTYIYTTAMPAAVAAATLASLQLVRQENWRREKLQTLISYFELCAHQIGLQPAGSKTAIQPILIGDSQRAQAVSEALLEQGIFVSAIRPPTVPKGSARLRITLSALHEKTHVEQLLAALEKALQ